jgi:hypothetical protein
LSQQALNGSYTFLKKFMKREIKSVVTGSLQKEGWQKQVG